MHSTLSDRLPVRLLGLVLLAAVALLTTGCDEEASGDGTKRTPAPSGPPVISFEFVEHDFGPIVDTQTYQVSFPFTNVGGDTLVINSVKAACGCTTPTLTKREYAPGETGTIDVIFNPKGKQGNTLKYITVVSNAGDPVKLKIDSDIRPLVTIEKLVRLGQVPLGQDYMRIVPFQHHDPDLVITDVSVNNANLEVRVASVGEVLSTGPIPLYGGQIEVTIKGTQPWGGLFAMKMTVAAYGRPNPNAQPVRQTYSVFILGEVFGDIRTDSTMMSLGARKPGDDFSKSALLTSSSGRPFEVLQTRITESTVPFSKVRHRQVSPSSYEVTVYGNLGSFVGSFRGTVEVTTGEADEGPLYLRFAGASRL